MQKERKKQTHRQKKKRFIDSSKINSLSKQCARSSVDSKQDTSADISFENQLKYLLLNQLKIAHNTVLKTNGL